MTATLLPSQSALSAEDEARLAELVAEVLASDAPTKMLRKAVSALDDVQQPALAAALYEALCYRVDVSDYWLQCGMAKAYRALGPTREDAAYFHAAAAVRMHPDYDGSPHMFRCMFLFLFRRGRDREALDLFRYQMQFSLALPAAAPEELAEIERRTGCAPEPVAPAIAPRPGSVRIHPVIPEERRRPWRCPVVGGDMPYALAPLAEGMTRPAITVAEFVDAEVLINHDTLVVLDRFGDLHVASSVAEMPAQVRAWFARQEAEGNSAPTHEADEAVVITDCFPLPNIGHMLFDHVTHLVPYQRLGVDTGRALVIGPEARLDVQQDILRRAGVTAYLGTDRVARVRVGRLWVSSNCADLRHAAHYGADWAVEFIRRTVGGRGLKGWRRLYLSRGEIVGRRQVVNEAEVIALLEPHGFEAIMPGRMPYAAQLAAFRQASHVIGPHGAALTHIVLCPPGAHVLEIFHPLHGTAAYAMQAEAAGIDYAAMVARDWESDAPEWNDPTRADPGGNGFWARHMRVDLPTLSDYLATVT